MLTAADSPESASAGLLPNPANCGILGKAVSDTDLRSPRCPRLEPATGEERTWTSTTSSSPKDSWPEGCPLSKEELCQELESALEEIRRLGERMQTLHDQLPPAPEDLGDAPGGFEDGPGSVYERLLWAVSYIVEDAIPDIEKQVRQALCATPESLRSEWLKHQVPGDGG